MLVWGLGFGVLVSILAPSYVAAAKAISGGLPALAAQALPIAQSFQFLTGPVDRLDTVGGYLSYKIFPDAALLVALYAAMQGAQIIRGSEARGLFDLWYAAGRTRSAIMRDRVIAFLVSLAVVIACIDAGTVVGGVLAGVQLVMPALGQCVAVGLVALFGFGLGLLLAQFCQTVRSSAAIASAYLVASFFVANMSDHLGAFTVARYLSPFYYYLQARTLVIGVDFDVASMAILLAAAAAAAAGAWLLFLSRDAGGVSLARVHHTRPADYRFRPSAVWHRSLWLNWIAEQRLALASWFLGTVAFTTIEAAVVPSAMKLVGSSTGSLKRFLGTNDLALTPDQYLSFFLSFTALLVAGFTVSQVARWASDATHHRNDVVLVQPVSMWRMLMERTAALVVASAMVGLAVILGIWLGAIIGGYFVAVAGLARAFFDIVLLSFAIGGVGLVAVTLLRSSAATGVTAALLVAGFFLTTLAGLLSWPSWTSRASVFDAFGSPYLSMPRTSSVVYLFLLGSGGVVAAYAAMRRGARVVA